MCRINKKIHNIGKYLASGDAVAVYHTRRKTAGAYEVLPDDFPVKATGKTDAIVSVIERRDGGGQLLMIVNKDFKKEQTLTFGVGDLNLKLVDGENGELTAAPVKDGVLTLALEAGDCALMVVDGDVISLPEKREDPNLAVAARLTATSAAGDGTAFLCNVHDGVYDDGARAALVSSDGAPQYMTFDLGTVKRVNRVDLYPGGKGPSCFRYFPESFTIAVSQDGVKWYTAAEEKEFSPDLYKVPVFRFTPVDARYVRVAVTGFGQKGGKGCAELGEVAIYNDDGTVPDDIRSLYAPPEENAGDSAEDGSRTLSVNKKFFEKGEPIMITAAGEKSDYLVLYPVAYVPGRDAGVYYACFDNAPEARRSWFTVSNGVASSVLEWFCATPQNPQVVPFIDVPEGEYKVVMRDSGGAVKLEVFFTVI